MRVSGSSSALPISSMNMINRILGFTQYPRTARTGSMRLLPPESPLGDTPSASALSARVQIVLEPLKRLLQPSIRISDFADNADTRKSAQNPRTARIVSREVLPPESPLENAPSASALCARVQMALEALSCYLVPPSRRAEAILHTIGVGRVHDPSQSRCGVSISVHSGRNRWASVCFARCRQAAGRTDMRCDPCLK